MKPVATLILNRNLPSVTDKLVDHIRTWSDSSTDVFVIESGSDPDKLSKYCTWYANWDEAITHGLRYSRGMNYGLSELWKAGTFSNYQSFLLLTNDTEFQEVDAVGKLWSVMSAHPQMGILSPCSKRWGERHLLNDLSTKYFWFIHNSALLLRRTFIESICNSSNPNFESFLFDGSNFRGYFSESELIAKAYANDWSAAITTDVWAEENESHLLDKSALIKTEPFQENVKLYVEEGMAWLKMKYGFNSRWTMQHYVKSFYNAFFEFHPELTDYKI